MFLFSAAGCCLLLLGKAKELGFVTKSLVRLGSGCFALFTNRHIKPMKLAKQFGLFLGMGCCVNARCWPPQSGALELLRRLLQWELGAVPGYRA